MPSATSTVSAILLSCLCLGNLVSCDSDLLDYNERTWSATTSISLVEETGKTGQAGKNYDIFSEHIYPILRYKNNQISIYDASVLSKLQ